MVDLDNDEDMDLYVTTQDINSPNLCYINDGNGNFSQKTQGVIVNKSTQQWPVYGEM